MPNKTTDTIMVTKNDITVTKNDVTEDKGRFSTPKNKIGYQYDYLVFIGRFQPFHLGHKSVVDEALKLAENVIMLIGSANCQVVSAIALVSKHVAR